MEGPSLRSFPRLSFERRIELRLNRRTIRTREAGNLSAGGVFVHARGLPLGSPVHVKIAAAHPFEAEGVVRYSGAGGVGIEFTAITEANRQRFDQLIEELTREEAGLPRSPRPPRPRARKRR